MIDLLTLKRIITLCLVVGLLGTCNQVESPVSLENSPTNNFERKSIDAYTMEDDPNFSYEILDTIAGDGIQTLVVRMVSQKWLTTNEVKDPTWWHWLSIVVPDDLIHDKALLWIGGGSRNRGIPQEPEEAAANIAKKTKSVVAHLHNVPNQPIQFVNDEYGPREEDEIIAYGWRKYLENGAQPEDAKWLARLPMTKAAVRALDVIEELSPTFTTQTINKFVVTGASKRGWTTWTTGAVDNRVIAIIPLVIDLLNIVPSFEHHWMAYGFWAPAVGNYEAEGIMNWLRDPAFKKLLSETEPYSFIERFKTKPKLLINASGDQFFLPDSWQFYWNDLPGEKHLRYPPNTDHSLRDSDVLETITSFYNDVITDTERPTFNWSIEENQLRLHTSGNRLPTNIKLWQAHNPDARDFRKDVLGAVWEASDIPLEGDGQYAIPLTSPETGYTGYFLELTFEDGSIIPLKLSTGVVVKPDELPHPPF